MKLSRGGNLLFCLALSVAANDAAAQSLNDGPIQLMVRVREVNTTFSATDFSLGFNPDDLTYKVYARDNIGSPWQGGGCLQSNFNPPGLSGDLNTVIFNNTYPGAVVPRYFDLRLEAWEDDLNADPLSGICGGYSRCNYDCCNFCCGVIVFGSCVGIREDDDEHCDANPFKLDMDYRLGPPCQWYNHGFVSGGCTRYFPRIESYWRFINGDDCASAIDLGTLSPGTPLTHYNSTECYNNNYGDPGNDVFVRFTLTQAMGVRISLCGGATFNTTLFLLDGSCNQLYQNLDATSCPPQSVIAENICAPGNYYVVIDGSTSAEMGVFTLTLLEDPSLTMNVNISSVNVTCNGLSDGFANAIVTGGTVPYQYLWTPGNFTTPSISGLAIGTYNVRITDARSCVINQSVTITQPLPLGMTSTGINPTCNGGSDGQVSVPLVSGGTLTYEYSIGGAYQPSSLFTGLPSGGYTATVRDINGCTASMAVTLTDPPRINGNITSTPVSCAGLNDGTITVNPTNGTPAYYCALDFPPVFTLCTGVYPNLPPGPHTVTIRDFNLCEVTEPVNIALVPALTINPFSKTNVSCHGYSDGAFQVVSTGGTPPINFSIDGGATFQLSPIFTGLVANLYTVLVEDFHGCRNTLTVQVDEPSEMIPSELFQFPVTCNGEADGLIVITASGGTGPYRYSLDSIIFYPSGAFDDLAGGTYHFIVVDNNNCVATLDAAVIEPAVIAVNVVSSSNASCLGVNDGTLTLGSTGGTPPFKYSINNGPFQTNATFTGLAPGNYVIGVEDKNDCVGFDSTTIGANVSVTATVTKTEVLCNGVNTGSIVVTGTSGTVPHSYSINNIVFQPSGNFNNLTAGNYSVIARDANGCRYVESVDILEPPVLTAAVDSIVNASCAGVPEGAIYITPSGGAGIYTFNWSNALTSEDIVNVVGGNYTVTVRDSNNCAFILPATIAQPNPAFTDITRIDDVSCFGEADGYADLDIVGGVPPFIYDWSDNSSNQDLLNISGGTYFVTVTDDSGCMVYDTATVVEPAVITSSIAATTVSCATSADADIDLTVSGGTPPYDYFWSNFAFTQDQTDIPAGTYTVLITDDEDCQNSDMITIASAPGLTATLNITDVSCFGLTDGEVEIIVNGGVPPYVYDWSNNQATPVISNLSPGIYDVQVIDSIACSGDFSALVEEPQELKVLTSSTDVLCFGDNTGLAIPFVTGGTGSYTFLWNTNPPSINPAQTSLRGGTYILEVRDENNCLTADTITVNEPAQLSIAVLGTENILCLNGEEGEVTVSASGGVAPYQYSVHANLFQSDSMFTELESGDYGVMVLDDNGCMATNAFSLTESTGFSVNLPPYLFISIGASDTIKPEIISPFPIVSYEWTPSDYLSCADCREPVVTPAQDVSYTLAVTDSNGCVVTDEITVVVKTEYEVFMPNVFSPNGDGNNDLFIPIDFGGVRTGTLKIFNRWGGMVYDSKDFNAGWDGTFRGKQVIPAVYVYYITGEFLDGNVFDATGSVTLVR